MTITEKADLAASYKQSGRYNCAQSVLAVFKDEIGLDEDTLISMGAGFAAGMGCMEATCGALIGAVTVAGLKSKGQGTVRLARQLLSDFKSKCGATICGDLKGTGASAPLCSCENCVRNAVLLLSEAAGF